MTKLTDLHTKEFLALLASDAPAPGGGGAAAIAASIASALTSMLANLTVGKKKFIEHEEEVKELLQQAENSRSRMLELAEADAEVFSAFMSCYRMPKDSEEEKALRAAAICQAAKQAAEIPLEIAEESLRIMRLTARLVQIGNPNVITDGAVSALLARAALRSSVYNILVNLKLTGDADYNDRLTQKAAQFEEEALQLERQTLLATDRVIGVSNK